MNQHLTAEVLEQYVIGALDAESVRFVEGHVAQCPACAGQLQREAQLEVALHEVAAHRQVVSLEARRRRRVRAAVASVALLAAGVLLSFAFAPGRGPASTPSLRRCDDQACVSRAQFDGVLTIGPGGEPIVPRYDAAPAGGAP